jgi:hypothetical protein
MGDHEEGLKRDGGLVIIIFKNGLPLDCVGKLFKRADDRPRTS